MNADEVNEKLAEAVSALDEFLSTQGSQMGSYDYNTCNEAIFAMSDARNVMYKQARY